jgi:hypothetical protein
VSSSLRTPARLRGALLSADACPRRGHALCFHAVAGVAQSVVGNRPQRLQSVNFGSQTRGQASAGSRALRGRLWSGAAWEVGDYGRERGGHARARSGDRPEQRGRLRSESPAPRRSAMRTPACLQGAMLSADACPRRGHALCFGPAAYASSRAASGAANGDVGANEALRHISEIHLLSSITKWLTLRLHFDRRWSVDKVNHMQDRIKTKLGVESTYRGPDPACLTIGLAVRPQSEACEETIVGSIGHEFEFLGVPNDYPECRYCWVVEENDVLMWIVLPQCGTTKNNVTLPF